MRSDFEVINENMVHDGTIFKVYSDLVRLPNGNMAVREYLHHPGAVAILPVGDDGTLYLIEQFRYAAKGTIFEVPAGTLGEGEDRDACAARELEEETGFRAGRMERLLSFFLCPGYSDEMLTLYRASELQESKANTEENEILELRPMTLDDAFQLISEGRIKDSKTLVALYSERIARGEHA
jgi:ADP-ribose pyrophosphatase